MIKIEINCEPDLLDAHIRALGFMRNPTAALSAGVATSPLAKIAEEMRNGTAKFVGPSEDAQTKSIFTPLSNGEVVVETVNGVVESVTVAAEAGAKANPDRPWGQPSPGKKRRTGAEIAEDEAYYVAHANDPPTVTNTPRAAEAAISTGAERVDPQDAADEAAETSARVSASEQLTLEDVRRAVAKWSEIVGPANVIAKLRDILGGYALIELPEADWRKAIDNLEWAAANPGSKVLTVMTAPDMSEARTDVIAALESKTATKEEVIAAIVAYGARYDGSKDPEKMPLTKEDLPKVFGKLFGKDVTGLGSMPKTPEAFGQITAAIVAATRDNPFKREART